MLEKLNEMINEALEKHDVACKAREAALESCNKELIAMAVENCTEKGVYLNALIDVRNQLFCTAKTTINAELQPCLD